MQFKLFVISATDSGESLNELNKFLRNHRILEESHELAVGKNGTVWHFCIKYLDGIKPINSKNRKGSNRPDSDIDIAFIFSELKDEIDMQIQLMKLRRKFDLRIEPHPFEIKDLEDENPFLQEILQTGILI